MVHRKCGKPRRNQPHTHPELRLKRIPECWKSTNGLADWVAAAVSWLSGQPSMNPASRNICRSIEAVSKALAEWTVSAQFEADTTLPQRYGEGARRRWVADTQARIGHLAQSLAVRCPELFADSVRWMHEAQAARGFGSGDLLLNLRSLRDVIAAELPPTVTEAALPAIEQAIGELEKPLADHGHARDAADSTADVSAPYLEALLAGRGDRAQSVVMNAADKGMNVPDIYQHILHPAMREIGQRWQMDEIGVADEHFATAVTQMVMSQLRLRFPEAPRCGLRMVATSASGDLHEIGVRMVADFFEMQGWDAVFLGANMPVTDMLTALIERDAHLVALSASSVTHLVSLGEAIEAIRTTPGCERIKVLVGGPPFNLVPRLWKEVGADGFASSASEAVAVGNRLVGGDAVRA
jgi:methanogenic corrinoid protein MtbC1